MNKATKLFSNEWISVFKSDKGFTYCQRKSIDSRHYYLEKMVKIFEFLIHYQPTPEIKEKEILRPIICMPILLAAWRKTKSYRMLHKWSKWRSRIWHKWIKYKTNGKNIATTQMNEKVFNFLVDVSGLKENEPTADGSIFRKSCIQQVGFKTRIRKYFRKSIYS